VEEPGVEGAAPGVVLEPGAPAPLSVPLVPPIVPPLVPGAVLVPGVLGVALELGAAPEVSGAVEPLVPAVPLVPAPPVVEPAVPPGAPLVPPVVPPALPVAPDVLEGVLVSPVVPASFFPHAPKARVATSAASNTECFISVPLKKYSCKLSTRLIGGSSLV